MRLEEKSLVYAAGVFDGEGCVQITRTPKSNIFYLGVRVTNTNRPLLDWLKAHFGGWIGNQTPNKKVASCRPCWYWATGSKAAASFLSEVSPYVVIKKDQVDLALEFHSRIGGWGVNRLTPEEITTRENYKRRLSELKFGCAPEDRTGLVDYAYVAGLLDGEGTILISMAGGSHRVSVHITNTDLKTLARLKDLFGGWVSSRDKPLESWRTKPCESWNIPSERAAEFLVEVYPYLIVKKENARLALEFQDKKRAMKISGASVPEKRAVGEEYKQKISELNRHGVAVAV